MKNLADIDAEAFGRTIVDVLQRFGFGVLTKADLEAALLHALYRSSASLLEADSYGRAEMLRLTDTRFRAIHRRAEMWLGDHEIHHDKELLTRFLVDAIGAYVRDPSQPEVRILIDDDIQRRNLQRALERREQGQASIAVDLAVSGRSLILKGSDLDQWIERVLKNPEGTVDKSLLTAIKDKKGVDRRQAFLNLFGKIGEPLIGLLIG